MSIVYLSTTLMVNSNSHIKEIIMFYLPLTASPLGWVILGVGGYALYKAGKKKGQDEVAASQITEPGTTDKAKTTTTNAKTSTTKATA